MRHIIIDCDPGHDDAIALLLALAHPDQLNLLGITTVGGNQTLEKVTENALKILALAGSDCPVAMGASAPLVRPLRVAPEAHGESGMDGPELPKPIQTPLKTHAVQQINHWMDSVPDSETVTLIALGPLTNIALWITQYPERHHRIACISLMGGGVYRGNVTAAAEFNIYADPESADIVFRSGIPILMSGLDVTEKAYILEPEYRSLANNGPVGACVAELLDFYSGFGRTQGYVGNALHDPCAVMAVLHPEFFEGEACHVDIVTDSVICRGMTLVDRRPIPAKAPNVQRLTEVNRQGFVTVLRSAISQLDGFSRIGGIDESDL